MDQEIELNGELYYIMRGALGADAERERETDTESAPSMRGNRRIIGTCVCTDVCMRVAPKNVRMSHISSICMHSYKHVYVCMYVCMKVGR